MKNRKLAFFTMDVESFYDTSCIHEKGINGDFQCVDGIRAYLELLKKYDIKGTFFIVGSFYDKHPEIVKEIISYGHDMGFHTEKHDNDYGKIVSSFSEDYGNFKNKVYKDLGVSVGGFRAPCFNSSNDLIEKLEGNVIFDSSITSDRINDYGFIKLGDSLFKKNNLIEFTPIRKGKLNISGGGYIRLLPWFIAKFLIKNNIRKIDSYVFYVHPFELCPKKLPIVKELGFLEKMYISRGRKTYIKTIEWLINLLKNSGFKFCSMKDYAEENIMRK